MDKIVSRDERQDYSVKQWLRNKGKGTVVATTGFGKTRVAVKAIQKVRTRNPNLSVLVLVPTDTLKGQWVEELTRNNLIENIDVQVMNGASKRSYICDMLVIDEAHRINAKTISNVFNVVKYKIILGLTATFERLDGRHEILAKYAPVVDEITPQEALVNGWVSAYHDYVVVIDVPNISEYKAYNREFIEHFSYFDYDFGLAMKMVGKNGFKERKNYCNQICKNPDEWSNTFKAITYHATRLMATMQARKKFIANHPEKLRVAQEIINRRQDKKIITFSSNVKMAEAFGNGYVYTGKESSKKKNRLTLEEFSAMPSGILHTCKLAEEGLNLPDLSVGIMLGINSSKTKQVQTLGRVIRFTKGKTAEFFTIVIRDTVEVEWMKKSRSSDNFEIIDEEALINLLDGKPYSNYKRKLQKLNFRF